MIRRTLLLTLFGGAVLALQHGLAALFPGLYECLSAPVLYAGWSSLQPVVLPALVLFPAFLAALAASPAAMGRDAFRVVAGALSVLSAFFWTAAIADHGWSWLVMPIPAGAVMLLAAAFLAWRAVRNPTTLAAGLCLQVLILTVFTPPASQIK